MTVVSVTSTGCTMPNRTATGEREYINRYRVITDNPNDGPLTVTNAAGIPARNSSWTFGTDVDLGAFAKSTTADYENEQKSRQVWIVTVRFSSFSERRNDDFEDDPLNQAPIISQSAQTFRKPAERERGGTLSFFTNSAGEQIPDVQVDDSRELLRIQINKPTINHAQHRDFADAVNNAPFFGLPAKKWKMSAPVWEQRWRGQASGTGTPYYIITYEFESREETWDVRLRDRGTYYLGPGGVETQKRVNGVIVDFVDLDGLGGELATGADPEYVTYEYYPQRDFSLLGIPTSL